MRIHRVLSWTVAIAIVATLFLTNTQAGHAQSTTINKVRVTNTTADA